MNLVDMVWGSARHPRPKNTIAIDVKYMDVNHAIKLVPARQDLTKQKARPPVVATLDEVAWLFNLCGSDIDFNAVFFGRAVVTTDDAIPFVNPERVKLDRKFDGRSDERGGYRDG